MRRLLLPLAVLAASALPAAAADATTYCVSKPACAAISGNLTAPTLKGAIDAAAAHAGQDAIELGAGTFPYPGSLPRVASSNDISAIAGMGQGTTHVAEGAAGALEVDDPGTLVSDLTVDVVAGNSSNALVLTGAGATARRVTVSGPADAGDAIGLYGGAVLDHVTVDVPTTGGGMQAAYVYGTGGATITDSSFTGAYGLRVNDLGTTTIRNVRTQAPVAPFELDSGTLDADGLLVTAPASASSGELVEIYTGATATATLRHATLVTQAGVEGIALTADGAGSHASLTARDLVIAGPGTAIERQQLAGGTATLNLAYSSYDAAKVTGVAGLPGLTDLALPADPGFVDAASGDYALRAGSPLIDRGEPSLPAGAATTDLAGGPRVAGGRTDIGAYEYAPLPPAVAIPISAPGTTTPTPAPAPAPAPAPPPVQATKVLPKLLLTASARQKLDRRGRFAVVATCAAALGCRGTVKLTARSGRRTVTLGSARLSLKSGARTTIHVRVSRAGRALLRRHAKLAISVSASARDGGGTRLPAKTAFSGRPR
jgi:hypothetical protein